MEYTSTRGHWNAIGLNESVALITEFGPIFETQNGMNHLIEVVREKGALCSLNHPYLKPWDWSWTDTPLELFNAVEIINDPTFPGNSEATELAIQMLDSLWEQGHQVWAIGGSDTHMLPTESYTEGGPPSIVGDPMTCVWTSQLSTDSILSAMKSGHVYVTRGPQLDPMIDVDGALYRPGDLITSPTTNGEDIELVYSLRVTNVPKNGRIVWLENAKVVETVEISGDGVYLYRTTWTATEYRWLRVEVRDAMGLLVAYVNPVYSGIFDGNSDEIEALHR